jgi:D-3-phosphoglycerate dehydrogenase / 2-oxoglutarate reductase
MEKIFVTSKDFGKSFKGERKKIENYLNENGIYIEYHKSSKPIKEDELIEEAKNASAIITYSNMDEITGKAIELLPKLKIIARHGIGYNYIDIKTAKKKGIFVTNTSEGAEEEIAVSDMAIALMFCLARNIINFSKDTKKGKWKRFPSYDIYRKTIGVIGMGKIGKMTAIKAHCLGMNVVACDPIRDSEFSKKYKIEYVLLEELLKKSDFVIIHCALCDSTNRLIDLEKIKTMKKNAFIINCARGQIVDENDLYFALKENIIAGAALDVFEKEPPTNNPLLELENTVTTPHIAAYTEKTLEAMDFLVLQACVDVINGNRPRNIVNNL